MLCSFKITSLTGVTENKLYFKGYRLLLGIYKGKILLLSMYGSLTTLGTACSTLFLMTAPALRILSNFCKVGLKSLRPFLLFYRKRAGLYKYIRNGYK